MAKWYIKSKSVWSE